MLDDLSIYDLLLRVEQQLDSEPELKRQTIRNLLVAYSSDAYRRFSTILDGKVQVKMVDMLEGLLDGELVVKNSFMHWAAGIQERIGRLNSVLQ